LENLLQSIDTLTIKFTLIAVALPLIAFIVNGLLPNEKKQWAGWISTGALFLSAVFSAFVFARVWNGHAVHQPVHWFTIGTSSINAGIFLNNLSVLLLLLVSLIALPVHIYSIAYMGHDAGVKRYFTYLSFFCFTMFGLVVADNLLLFYVFWELVGFSSYLLIGFWFTRDKAVFANKKAFIINRIGDIGLLTAIIIIFDQFQSFDLDILFNHETGLVMFSSIDHDQWLNQSHQLPAFWQQIAFWGIFLAVAAKSAQFPLHTWLPNAMEGPTSISALIHAATMVAAGVFLLGRVYPLFTATEFSILAMAGCFTAFMGATIAITQNDLKRILAYSTISQLGFMVMAMGVGAYSLALLQLVVHAFFKCLLFLVAGIVIHQMAHIRDDNKLDIDPQNIQLMGGLRKKLPVTFAAAIIAGLALIGLPLFSGFLSKDEILVQTFEWAQGKRRVFMLVPIMDVVTTCLTAFYTVRLIVKVFFGELRVAQTFPSIKIDISDRNWLYRLPLLFLAVCCFFPLFSTNPVSVAHSWLFKGLFNHFYIGFSNFYHVLVPVAVTAASLLTFLYAWLIYTDKAANPFPQKGLLFNFSCKEWYIDIVYNYLVVKPVIVISRVCFWIDRRVIDGLLLLFAKTTLVLSKVAAFTDRRIIDGSINLLVKLVRGIGRLVGRFQGGKVQYYLYTMLAAVLLLFILKVMFQV
jgi:NADH-quinone oxidoreductase subunit L